MLQTWTHLCCLRKLFSQHWLFKDIHEFVFEAGNNVIGNGASGTVDCRPGEHFPCLAYTVRDQTAVSILGQAPFSLQNEIQSTEGVPPAAESEAEGRQEVQG